jgi:hypothetical protein
VTGEWRKLHNENLNNLYSSPSIVGTLDAENEKAEAAYGSSF